jgi:hypothetical protein
MATEPSQAGAEPTQAAEPSEAGAEGVNQGATGARPMGESPLSAQSDTDPFAERPEAYVGAAFAGGLALALLLRRLAS